MMTQLQPLAVSLHRLTKTQLADLVFKMKDNISSAIENLTKVVSLINANFKKLEAGLAVACNVNDKDLDIITYLEEMPSILGRNVLK